MPVERTVSVVDAALDARLHPVEVHGEGYQAEESRRIMRRWRFLGFRRRMIVQLVIIGTGFCHGNSEPGVAGRVPGTGSARLKE